MGVYVCVCVCVWAATLYVRKIRVLTQHVNTREYIALRIDNSYLFPIWGIFCEYCTQIEN